jgi:hypothetical protein
LIAAAWTLDELVRARRTAAAETAKHAAAVEREKPAKDRTAVAEERARINRELHDIVAHNVSLMVVQAIAADRVQDHARPHRDCPIRTLDRTACSRIGQRESSGRRPDWKGVSFPLPERREGREVRRTRWDDHWPCVPAWMCPRRWLPPEGSRHSGVTGRSDHWSAAPAAPHTAPSRRWTARAACVVTREERESGDSSLGRRPKNIPGAEKSARGRIEA